MVLYKNVSNNDASSSYYYYYYNIIYYIQKDRQLRITGEYANSTQKVPVPQQYIN